MRFGVLGPLTVWHGHEQVTVPTRMLRRLLALFLAQAGTPVAVDVVIDALWHGRPPTSARKTLSIYVHRLRRVLGDDVVVSFGPAGYTLEISGHELDARLFDSLVAQLRAARVDPVAARSVAAEALRLWRGPAYLDVRDIAPVAAEADRLDDERLAVFEERAELDLAAGAHAGLIAELAAAVGEHPFRERLCGQLMLASYRAGRRADALAAYRRTRDILVAELGIEPGDDLRTLHERILRDAPELHQRSAAAGIPVPNQLPPVTPTFVGRTHELAEVVSRLTGQTSGPVLVSITGMGGLGKTTLAVRAAMSGLSHYPDGCLYTDLRGTADTPAEPHQVLGGFLRSLGVADRDVPHDPDERLGLFRSLTTRLRLLQILDNAADEAQVRPLLPAGERCAVIVTSRRELSTLDCTAWVRPDLLTDEQSADLLTAIVGAPRFADGADTIGVLVRRCGGLPLAVRIVAARLAGQPRLGPAYLAAALTDPESTVHELAAGDLSLRASLMFSYRRLTESAATLLPMIAAAGHADFSVWACSVLLDQPANPADSAITELTLAHLADPAGGDRYRLHDLVHGFANTLPGLASLRATAERRMLHALLVTTHTAAPLLIARHHPDRIRIDVTSEHGRTFATPAEALTWFDSERDNLVGTVRLATQRGRHVEAWQLACELRAFFAAQHRFDEYTAILAIALESARALGDPLAEAKVQEQMAVSLSETGQFEQGLALNAVVRELYASCGSTYSVARCYNQLGVIRALAGDLAGAEECHLRALAVPEYATFAANAAASRINLGAIYGKRGDYPAAIAEFVAVLDIATGPGDSLLACVAHHNLADAYLRLGSQVNAIAHARSEIAIAEQTGYPLREARGWELLGSCLTDTDQLAAGDAWRRALAIYDRISPPDAAGLRGRIPSNHQGMDAATATR